MLTDWVIQYTKSREGEFCIPNPRLYGRGKRGDGLAGRAISGTDYHDI